MAPKHGRTPGVDHTVSVLFTSKVDSVVLELGPGTCKSSGWLDNCSHFTCSTEGGTYGRVTREAGWVSIVLPSQIWDCLAFFTFCVLSETHISIHPPVCQGKLLKSMGLEQKATEKVLLTETRVLFSLSHLPISLVMIPLCFHHCFLPRTLWSLLMLLGKWRSPTVSRREHFHFTGWPWSLPSLFSRPPCVSFPAASCLIKNSWNDCTMVGASRHSLSTGLCEELAWFHSSLASRLLCSLPFPAALEVATWTKQTFWCLAAFPGTKHNMPVTSPDKPAPLFPLACWN